MDVVFTRTGARRYSVTTILPDGRTQAMDPAPGFDEDIPHDLVHYLVEAELGLTSGVFGRAASGGGTFLPAPVAGESPRERARAIRKQKRKDQSFDTNDILGQRDLELSERLAAVSDLFWRRRHGQQPDARPAPRLSLTPAHQKLVERVVDGLDRVAPLWHALPVGGTLVFVWPAVLPKLIPRE